MFKIFVKTYLRKSNPFLVSAYTDLLFLTKLINPLDFPNHKLKKSNGFTKLYFVTIFCISSALSKSPSTFNFPVVNAKVGFSFPCAN